MVIGRTHREKKMPVEDIGEEREDGDGLGNKFTSRV